jgi:hypothetical protein
MFGRSDGTGKNLAPFSVANSQVSNIVLVYERTAEHDTGRSSCDGGSVAHRPGTSKQHGHRGRVRKCRSVVNIQMPLRQLTLCEKGGLDECAKAANIYQCGRDKAPNVTQAMLDAAAAKNIPVS